LRRATRWSLLDIRTTRGMSKTFDLLGKVDEVGCG
jgi:hypothetical protein